MVASPRLPDSSCAKSKGVLSYDADGSGKGAAIKFAQITKGLVIDHKNFFVI